MTDNAKMWLSLAIVTLGTGIVLFGVAGTLDWWRGWVFLVVFVGGSVASTVDLMRRDPALLKRRLSGGPLAETEPAQRVIVTAIFACFVALLVVPALDYRGGGADASPLVGGLGIALVVLGFLGVVAVYRANTFAAATVGVAADQHVISTGPYAIVRHPMYASALPFVFGTPLALGSWRGLVPALLIVPLLVWRLVEEERVLRDRLPGYTNYADKVRWRLVPGVY